MVLMGQAGNNKVAHVVRRPLDRMVTCHQVCHLECHQMVDIQTVHIHHHQVVIRPHREATVVVHQEPVRRDPVQKQIQIQRHLHRHHRQRNIWVIRRRPRAMVRIIHMPTHKTFLLIFNNRIHRHLVVNKCRLRQQRQLWVKICLIKADLVLANQLVPLVVDICRVQIKTLVHMVVRMDRHRPSRVLQNFLQIHHKSPIRVHQVQIVRQVRSALTIHSVRPIRPDGHLIQLQILFHILI